MGSGIFFESSKGKEKVLDYLKRQIILRKKKIVATNYCDGLVGASFFGSKHIVDLMIYLGCEYFEFGLRAAAFGVI